MNTYGSNKRPEGDLEDGSLPEVLQVDAVRVRYDKPRYFEIRLQVVEIREAIEIRLQTAKEFPAVDDAPVLIIGETVLSEMKQVGNKRYTFYAFESDRLNEGDPIALRWYGPQFMPIPTRFRFHLRGGPNVT